MSRPPPKADSLPVLIVQHAAYEHPAAVLRALETQGIRTRLLHPYLGEKHPRVDEIRGVISLGGPMSANDEAAHPWIRDEIDLLRQSVEGFLPTVGICLGGQMLARAMGGSVEKSARAELGWFPIDVLEDGREDPVLGAAGDNPTVYQWHEDSFQLPKEALLLASSPACPRQAYRIGEHAYGFQFHPEADHQLVLEWLSFEEIADEIEQWKREHGAESVQDVQTQRNFAYRGEKGSLKITAAIGSLFRTQRYFPLRTGFREHLEQLATGRTSVVLEVNDADGQAVAHRGVISSFLTIDAGDFVIFQEESTLLWPLRIDDIVKVSLA